MSQWAWLHVWVEADDLLVRSEVGPPGQTRDHARAEVQAALAADPAGDDADPYGDLTTAIRRIDQARHHVDDLLDERDHLIRQSLATGTTYRALGEATGLSRAAIRQGRRSPR